MNNVQKKRYSASLRYGIEKCRIVKDAKANILRTS
ncbi:hypothetical protein SAMN05518849_1259 [Sphingobium sp. AP50]|nr:hypothetical protein SAMN05518849_1259 [Sphingobium sp. AP50]